MNDKEDHLKFHIERALAEDYSAVCGLIAKEHELHVLARSDLFQPCEIPLSKTEFDCMRRDEACYLYTAKTESGCLAGLCFARLKELDSPLLVKNKTLYIEDFIVEEPYRRHGIGRMLYTRIKEAAALAGAVRVELTVWNFNETALSFYRALGMDIQYTCMEEKN